MAQIILKAPLVDITTAMMALDKSEAAIFDMIDNGTLLYAWDIRGFGQHRQCLRIASSSIAAVQLKKKDSLDFEAAVHEIFPRHFVHFTTSIVAKKLRCSNQHVERLFSLGQIDRLPGAINSHHPMKFSRETLVRFLKARRVI